MSFISRSFCLILLLALSLPGDPALAQRHPRRYKVLQGHDNFVTQMAIDSKARLLATVSLDGTVRLWHLPGGRAGAVLRAGEEQEFSRIALSQDGKRLAATVGSRVHLFDPTAKAPTELGKLEGHASEIADLAFQPDGSALATAADGVRIWSLATGKEIGKISSTGRTTCVAFSPAANDLAACQTDAVHLYDRSFFKEKGKVAQGKVVRLTFGPKGELMALLTREPSLVLVEARSGSVLWTQQDVASETSVAFNESGNMVLAGGRESKVTAYDAREGKMKWFVTGNEGIRKLTTRGKILATGGDGGAVWLWRY